MPCTNYTISIYEKFYSAITSVVNDFKININEKFYKKHIEESLNKYINYLKYGNSEIANFINMKLNLNEIFAEVMNILSNEYKDIASIQIDSLYQEKTRYLDEVISFSYMKSKIKDIINQFYNSNLYKSLIQNYNNYYFNQQNYDFSDSIINDIDASIEGGVEEVKKLMKKMEGANYEMNDTFQFNPLYLNEYEFKIIQSDFIYFAEEQIKNETELLNTYI